MGVTSQVDQRIDQQSQRVQHFEHNHGVVQREFDAWQGPLSKGNHESADGITYLHSRVRSSARCSQHQTT